MKFHGYMAPLFWPAFPPLFHRLVDPARDGDLDAQSDVFSALDLMSPIRPDLDQIVGALT